MTHFLAYDQLFEGEERVKDVLFNNPWVNSVGGIKLLFNIGAYAPEPKK